MEDDEDYQNFGKRRSWRGNALWPKWPTPSWRAGVWLFASKSSWFDLGRALLVAGLAAASSVPTARAQATPLADAAALRPGTIAGRAVLAIDGRPAAGARVMLASGTSGGAAPITTAVGEDGKFHLAAVPAGSYELALTARGGATLRLVDLVVRPGQTMTLDTLALPWAPPAGGLAVAQTYVVEPGRMLVFPYRHWTATETILEPGQEGEFDQIGVKNPSIVRHGGQWHLFYTSKPLPTSEEFKTALGYVSAPELSGLMHAPRTEMRPILGDSVISPQVFYFEPQKLWYLIGHIGEPSRQMLEPVYSTNLDIANVRGWSPVRRFDLRREQPGAFWIDFWVICDERKAHLFYSDHSGGLYRVETPLAEFPHGLARGREQMAFKLAGKNSRGEWRFYDASHIYRVRSANKYLALLEGAYAHPTRRRLLDARNRFLTAMVADQLEGPWRAAEARAGEFVGEERWLFDGEGKRLSPRPVSHPEIIRAGYDQRLELEDFQLQVLFQTFDARDTAADYNYHELPWRLMLMRNY